MMFIAYLTDGGTREGETARMLEHHDGDIVIYPRRLDLILYACAQTFFLGAIITIAMLIFTHDANQERGPLGIIAVGMLALLLLYFACSEVFRVVVRRPAIIINSDGVTDNWSLIYGGLGLIRWSEIEVLSCYVRKTAISSQHFFMIFPDESVLARRSRWQRFISGGIRFAVRGTITISCMALPLSPQELLAEIKRRFARQLHAHHISIVAPRKPAS